MKCHFAILQLVFVFASCQQYGDLRLDGRNLLQIYFKGVWMPVCYEGFNEAAAATACRQMGYTTFNRFDDIPLSGSTSTSYVTQCPTQEDYVNHGLLHILRCNGNEQSSCSQGDVWLDCKGSQLRDEPYNGQVMLNTTAYFKSSGKLTLYYDNKWLPVCCEQPQLFNKFAADSACRQLGYTGASSQSIDLYQTRDSTWRIGDSNGGTCDKSYSCLKSCCNKNPVPINCQPCNITCIFDTDDEKTYLSGSKAECTINGNDVDGLPIALGILIPLLIVISIVSLVCCICCYFKGQEIKRRLCCEANPEADAEVRPLNPGNEQQN